LFSKQNRKAVEEFILFYFFFFLNFDQIWLKESGHQQSIDFVGLVADNQILSASPDLLVFHSLTSAKQVLRIRKMILTKIKTNKR
jgi:hypothetical protein